MLVTSLHSSTQRPLGLSVEELYALDRQYRRIEQQQHLSQLQAQTRLTSSNLNRLNSRSLDLVSSNTLPRLPPLEIRGHPYAKRPPPPPPPPPSSSTVLNYQRSHSSDQLRYIPPPPTPIRKYNYPQRTKTPDVGQQNSESKYSNYFPQPTIPLGNNFFYDLPQPSNNYSDTRSPRKLRRQPPIKRESSRRIVVRPIVNRRREPSISSSCESLDDLRPSFPPPPPPPIESNISNQSLPFNPSTSLIENVLNNLTDEGAQTNYNSFSSDDNDINFYEMRIPIGKTYDTSDISVQLEGSKILIHCHTIEPTDKRGNYRKHEYKSELIVPDIVDDETIVAYLTEDGQLIVEGKYHLWAWNDIKKKNKKISKVNDRPDLEQERPTCTNNRINRIEKLDNNRTIIHINEPVRSSNNTIKETIWDGQYFFTHDNPPVLIYHLRLPYGTLMNTIHIESDTKLNLIRIFIEQEEKNLIEKENEQLIISSTARLCRLPKDHYYDYNHIRMNLLKENFIRIEIPTFN